MSATLAGVRPQADPPQAEEPALPWRMFGLQDWKLQRLQGGVKKGLVVNEEAYPVPMV